MSYTFWIPVAIALITLIWNYYQSKRILKLETEARTKKLIRKYQFEKEFSVYKDMWPKLVELKEAAEALRPILDVSYSNQEEEKLKKQERLKALEIKYHLVRDFFERNKPFYSQRIYDQVKSLLIVLTKEFAEYQLGDPNDEVYWESKLRNADKIVEYVNKTSDLIRERIRFDDN